MPPAPPDAARPGGAEPVAGQSATGERGRAPRAGAGRACSQSRAGRAADEHAPGGQSGSDRRAGAELRAARHDAVGDPRPEYPERQQRQRGEHHRHGVLDRRLGGDAGGEFAEDGRADADDDREHQHLDARGDHQAEHAFGEKRGLAPETERHEHEARQRRQLELDQRHEELDRQDEEGEEHDRPGEQQDRDLDGVLEEADEADQIGNGIENRPSGVEPDLGDPAGLQQFARAQGLPPEATRPRPAKLSKTMRASAFQLPMM